MSGSLCRPANVLLDDADISRLTREFVEVGGDPSRLRFNSGRQTSYVAPSEGSPGRRLWHGIARGIDQQVLMRYPVQSKG